MIDLSILIVSYNVRDYLKGCLQSLYRNAGDIRLEVIVVDNASKDGSASMVRENFPKSTLMENRENLGFARANNQAMAQSSGRYVLLLNPDTEVFPSCLENMVHFMDAHPEAGALGARTWSDPGKTLQWGDDKPLTPSMLLLELTFLGRLLPNNRVFRKNWEMDWNIFSCRDACPVETVNGHCLLARREAVQDIGPMDERFFLYFEDVDWCLRIRKKGWKLYLLKDAEVVHYVGKSRMGEDHARIFMAGLGPFLKKHYGQRTRYAFLSLLFLLRGLDRASTPFRRALRKWQSLTRKSLSNGVPVLSPADPVLSWPGAGYEDPYLIELSGSPSFLFKGAAWVQGTHFRLPEPFFTQWPDGQYYWRAAPFRNNRLGTFFHGSFQKNTLEGHDKKQAQTDPSPGT